MLTTAELLGAYYDLVLHASVHSVWPSDILYFFFPPTMALALLLRRRTRAAEGINWAECFDFLQLGILTAAVYLYYFYLPSHWQASAPEMEQLQWRVGVARDVFLVLAFAFRLSFFAPGWNGRCCRGSALSSHCLVWGARSLHTDKSPLEWIPERSGTCVTPCRCWSRSREHALGSGQPRWSAGDGRSSGARRESLGSLWLSVLLPLVVLGVASRMVHELPLVATTVVVVTLASSGVRSLLTQRHEQQSAQAMVAAEQKFRILFQDNPQPTYLYDPDTGRFLEINRAACEKYGYTRGEFLALTVADVCLDLPPEKDCSRPTRN